jgi:hypothetical protein
MPVFLQNVFRRPFLVGINIAGTKVRINLNVCILYTYTRYSTNTHLPTMQTPLLKNVLCNYTKHGQQV